MGFEHKMLWFWKINPEINAKNMLSPKYCWCKNCCLTCNDIVKSKNFIIWFWNIFHLFVQLLWKFGTNNPHKEKTKKKDQTYLWKLWNFHCLCGILQISIHGHMTFFFIMLIEVVWFVTLVWSSNILQLFLGILIS